MTPKQRRFVEHYIETGSSIESFRLAGYSGKTRNSEHVCACQLLRKTNKEIQRRSKEIYDAGSIRIESKRSLLWEIARKASGVLKTDKNNENEPFQPDYKAAIAAINELNRMDGHHSEQKIQLKNDRFTFDAEILPPEAVEAVEAVEFMQLPEPKLDDK